MKQEYKTIPIEYDQIRHRARQMRRDGVILAMIHGYLDTDGSPVVSYEYQVGTGIESYTIRGRDHLPSISGIYDEAAAWPERELNELYGFTFEGLDTSKRLFLPDNMLSGQGQIIVTPMKELIKNRYGDENYKQAESDARALSEDIGSTEDILARAKARIEAATQADGGNKPADGDQPGTEEPSDDKETAGGGEDK